MENLLTPINRALLCTWHIIMISRTNLQSALYNPVEYSSCSLKRTCKRGQFWIVKCGKITAIDRIWELKDNQLIHKYKITMFSLTIYNYNRYKFYRKSNLVPELKELSLNPYLKATTEMYLFNRNECVQEISTNNLVLLDDWVLIKESIFFLILKYQLTLNITSSFSGSGILHDMLVLGEETFCKNHLPREGRIWFIHQKSAGVSRGKMLTLVKKSKTGFMRLACRQLMFIEMLFNLLSHNTWTPVLIPTNKQVNCTWEKSPCVNKLFHYKH